MAFINYYQLLGLNDTDVTCRDIQKAYRKKAFDLHPDRLTDPEKIAEAPVLMSEMAKAKETLCDPCKKSKYDEELAKHIKEDSVTDSVNVTEMNNKNVTNIDKIIPKDIVETLRKYFAEFANDELDLEGDKPANFDVQTVFHKYIPGNTFLHLALLSGMPDLAKSMILSCNEDMYAENALGYTPLHYAAMLNYTEIAALLMDYGAKISTNHFGETPLHNALQGRYTSTANVMLERADKEEFDTIDRSGNSPSDLARKACESNMTPECETLYAQLGIDTENQAYSLEIVGGANNTTAWFNQ